MITFGELAYKINQMTREEQNRIILVYSPNVLDFFELRDIEYGEIDCPGEKEYFLIIDDD